MSNQGQVSQELHQDMEQLENIIQQLKAEIDNMNANTKCRQLAHITTRFWLYQFRELKKNFELWDKIKTNHKRENAGTSNQFPRIV